MRDFQRKQKIRRVLYSKVMIVIVLVLLVQVSRSTFGLYAKERDSRRNLDRVEGDLAALTDREARLMSDIERLKTPEGIESEIRVQFQVAKPGERMVVLVEEEKVPQEEMLERSLVSKFFDIFR